MKKNNTWSYWVTFLLQSAVFGIGIYMMVSYPVGAPPFVSGLAFVMIAAIMLSNQSENRG